jgi:hypothetical protein
MKITIQSGINIWRIAGRTVPVDGVGIYQGRLLSEVRMTKQLARVGNTPITLPINIRNNDAYIASNIDLWGADVTVVSDSGYTWRGKITAYDSDGGGVMYITATEKSAPELLIKFPDEVARLVTLDENFHVSAINVTLPMVIGGTVEKPILVKGILIDKTAGIYLLCVGENHQIPNVYRGTELLTAGFVAYTGTAGQANYPGFAYVQLTDETLRKNDDGTYVEISADVVGLKLGTHTIEECRNGARFLLWLLKTAREGVGGWGLGIAESDIDLDAFNTAIARIDTAGLKMDGIFYFRQIAQSWIDQICHAIRGSYSIGDNGKRRLFVNASAASRKTYTKKNIKLLRYGKGAYTGQVYNKGKIEFGFNPLVGQFTQSAQYEDATSIGAIDEQEFTGQSYLVSEMATGKALIDYTCKKSLIGATKVYFETKELPDDCHEGDIITVDYPEKGLSGTWQINILDIGDRKHRIEAEKFSDTIFVSGTPGTAIDWVTDAAIIPSITPGAASGLTLSSEIRPGADGTNIVVLSGTFTQPTSAYLAASIEYGEGALPILDWKSLGMVQGNSFEVVPVKPAQLYAVRIRMISSTGKSDYITATLTTQGDDVPPGKPSISATSSLKTVSISLLLASVPSDMAGFQIFRNTTNVSGTANQIGYVASTKGFAQTFDINTEYGTSYYYWAKAIDTWGNPSAFSDSVGPITISAIVNSDISNQLLKMPMGSIMRLSANNCTDASIAEEDGVKDVSFNGNHGQAFGGVTIVDSAFGKAFGLDGVDGFLDISGVNTGTSAISIHLRFNVSALPARLVDTGPTTRLVLEIFATGQLGIYDTAWRATGVFFNTDTDYALTVCCNGTTAAIYQKGALTATINFTSSDFDTTSTIGSQYQGISSWAAGVFADIRVYDRVLTAPEVKTLYMLEENAVFAQLTADLIGANAIRAKHLVVNEAVITDKAQMANLTVDDANIIKLHGSKVAAGTLAITGLESSAQTTINTAFTNADTALTNAATAQGTANTAANTAVTNAATANGLLADIAADNKLVASEKQDARREWDIIAAEKAGINSQATTFGITTENTTYNNAFQALATYLNAGTTWSSGIPSWIADANLAATTTIVGATFRANWKAYYDARTALLNAIAVKAKTLADTAQGTANTAVSDAATANTKAGNLAATGLGVKVNFSAFSTANSGELYLHGFVASTGAAADVDGWVEWNGADVTVTKGMINPNAICPYNVPLFVVQRSGTKYIVWFETESMAWKYSAADAGSVLGTWTWATGTDIVLLTFTSPSSEGALIGTQLFTPPKTNKDVVAALDAAIFAWAVNNDLTYINGAKLYTGTVFAEALNVAALKAPAGAIAAWSAKGATTASIALSGGVKDVSGNSKHGTAVGGVAIVNSAIGQAFSFDGTNDYINISGLSCGTGAITVHMRIIPSVLPARIFDTGPTRFIVQIESTGALRIYDTAWRETGITVSAGENCALTITADGTTANVYKNGAIAASVAFTSNDLSTTSTLGAVYTGASTYYNGLIVNPKIYPRALTAAEVKTLYMLGTDSESGIITADRVVTGQIKSLNYSTTAGSLIDLDSGDIKMGGSDAPRFSFTNSTNTGVFAGFTFNATDLTAGATTTAIGISTDTAKWAFWAGSATSSSAPFRVTHAGALVASNATLTGAITATSGIIGGYTIDGNDLFSDYSSGTSWNDIRIESAEDLNPCGIIMSLGISNVVQSAVSITTGSGSGSSFSSPIRTQVTSTSYYGFYTTGKVYADGGFHPASDENCKSEIEDVSVLNSLRQIRVKKYHLDDYKIAKIRHEKELLGNLKSNNVIASKSAFPSEPEVENYNPCKSIGVMAQDFNKAFGIGNNNEETYNLTDAIGVALRAIQELAEIVDDQAETIAVQSEQIALLLEMLGLPKMPEKQKKQAVVELTAEEIEKAADSHVKAAYNNIMQEVER